MSKLLAKNQASFLLRNKLTLILVGVILILLIGGVFAFQQFVASRNADLPAEEVDLAFDAEGPYALLVPRRDGNALILQLKRTSSYDSVTYELAYVAKPDDIVNKPKSGDSEDGTVPAGGIDRGVVGEINTSDKKGEYEQEILFGTCSKNVCKYDQGVENGTLTLHIKKGKDAYRMVTQWHLQKPDVALGSITSGDNHFVYKTSATREELTVVGYSIVNELTGVPKLPFDKSVIGKVYALNVPTAKTFPKGEVTIEMGENPPDGSKIARYNEAANQWDLLETQTNDGKLIAQSPAGGIFAVLAPK